MTRVPSQVLHVSQPSFKAKVSNADDGGGGGLTTAQVARIICDCFGEAQHGAGCHRKNIRSLKSLLVKIDGNVSLENQFFMTILKCVMVVLGTKRTDEIGCRLMRFFAGFIVFCGQSVKTPNIHNDEDDDGGHVQFTLQTPNSSLARFMDTFMIFVLEHLDCKDKVVRTRLCQLIVACMSGLEELADEVWHVFRVKVPERLFDKEAGVRMQALLALARLQAMPLSDGQDLLVQDIFLDLLQHDPTTEVRRLALLHIEVTDKTKPFVLGRCRDVEVAVRRAFYQYKMAEVDFASLTQVQRDDILRAGLFDRYALDQKWGHQSP